MTLPHHTVVKHRTQLCCDMWIVDTPLDADDNLRSTSIQCLSHVPLSGALGPYRSVGEMKLPAALLMRMSGRPSWSRQASTAAATAAASRTSAETGSTRLPVRPLTSAAVSSNTCWRLPGGGGQMSGDGVG